MSGQYVAFLRGVNIRTRLVKMDDLRGWFEELDFANVSTFIASGNVIFEAAQQARALETAIERHLKQRLGFEVMTFVRSAAQVRAIAEHEAFDKDETGTVYIAILRDTPSSEVKHNVLALATEQDALAVHGREVYWLSRGGFGQSPVGGGLAKLLGAENTVRNANTLKRLAAKVGVRDDDKKSQPARRSSKVSASTSSGKP